MKRLLTSASLIALLFSANSLAGEVHLMDLTDNPHASEETVYKTVGGRELKLYVFYPEGHKPADRRSAVVCIHGGGWYAGTPQLFFPHARYFSLRGAVGFSVQYRLLSSKGVTVFDTVSDCKSAMRFIRKNAGRFGIDRDRMAVMGDSAGGHLAACMAVVDDLDAPGEDTSVSAMANATLLYNPIADTVSYRHALNAPGIRDPKPEDGREKVRAFGETPEERSRRVSPFHNVKRGQAPTLLMQGEKDPITPAIDARRLADAMKKAGNRCDYVELPEEMHAFVLVNYTASEEIIVEAIRVGDRFLASLGYLDGEPTLTTSKPVIMPEYIVYKKVDDRPLRLYAFYPPGHKPTDRRPAVACIHGSDWLKGDPRSHFRHARYLASRGIAAFVVSHRLAGPSGPTVFDSLTDCSDAFRYIRARSAQLGVDPERIAVLGDSAGAHLAACLGTLNDPGEPGALRLVSTRPSAMLLLNPLIDTIDFTNLKRVPGVKELEQPKPGQAGAAPKQTSVEAYGTTPEERARRVSPYHHIAAGQPPALLLHGAVVHIPSMENTQRLAKAMRAVGNRCDYVVVQGVAHPLAKAREEIVIEVTRAVDRFLVSLGYLEGEPTLGAHGGN